MRAIHYRFTFTCDIVAFQVSAVVVIVSGTAKVEADTVYRHTETVHACQIRVGAGRRNIFQSRTLIGSGELEALLSSSLQSHRSFRWIIWTTASSNIVTAGISVQIPLPAGWTTWPGLVAHHPLVLASLIGTGRFSSSSIFTVIGTFAYVDREFFSGNIAVGD
jgi:hypothetical protein